MKLVAQIVLIAACLALKTWGCPNNSRALEILRAEGYTSIKVLGGGHGWSCGDEGSATAFTATTASGHVEGVVCCGLLAKACTVRIEKAGTR